MNNISEAIIRDFEKAVFAENELSKTNFSLAEVLESIMDVAYKYSHQSRLRKANDSHPEIIELNSGLRRVANHIVTKYSPEDLRVAMAKINRHYIGLYYPQLFYGLFVLPNKLSFA